ncbi:MULTISPECIES: hypothetical protein [unclassified Gordonia (in: high G+C Gram-positive bacteria)]|uniref:hypothetical protein n=1 Tax=Gordonia TaxID=2053 RepID=UPI0012E3B10F|nr:MULTISPECIES: hypothetical protein [Gordonia]MBR7193254.1 hypothetical protein [Gordonia sp. SCSIO 19800]MDT0222091.1 hypothetical protein [Gordonia sp. AC31]UPG66515.1 hypothetical protein MVF96_13410 [Gordonia hongkongensis]
MIDVSEASDVEARLGDATLSQPVDEIWPLRREVADQVDGVILRAGRESEFRRPTAMPAGVAVLVLAEADHTAGPDDGPVSGDLSEQGDQFIGLVPTWTDCSVEHFLDRRLGRPHRGRLAAGARFFVHN